MKNILIPTDFSENAWNATKYALQLFKNSPCNFYLFHVTLISYSTAGETPLMPSIGVLEESLLKQAKESLLKLMTKAKKTSKNPNHNFFVISNYDFFIDGVKKQIEEKKIDLIVMGTKGASGFSEMIIGSNTGDLITRIKCPTLIIPENTTFKPPKEIAFPTDYNIFYQHKVLSNISKITKLYDANVNIVHVTKKDEELTDFQLENKEFLNNYFSDEKHSFYKITNSKIEAGIQCFVESRKIDMIIMIAKNLNLFQRVLFKPTVEEISYHTDIPFFVVHE